MRTVLCFGDSNTYGYDPGSGLRLDPDTRWPGVLRNQLGPGWWIVEEGCPGRTTVWDDPVEGRKSGACYLPDCLCSHAPVDLLILLLGTNDLKRRFALGPDDVARGAGALVDLCRTSAAGPGGSAPQVLLIAPPPLAPLAQTPFEEMFAGGEEKSRGLGSRFQRVASEKGCTFLDAGALVVSSRRDAIHLEASEHAKLGAAVAEKVRGIFAC